MGAVGLAAALWALGATVASRLFHIGVDAVELVEVRTFITATGLMLISLARPRARRRTPDRASLRLVPLGVSIAVANGAFFLAISRLPVAIAIVLQNLAPVFVIGWNAIALRRLPSWRVRLALAGAVLGVALVVGLPGSTASNVTLDGVGFGLATALGVAGFTLLGERASRHHDSVGVMTRAFAVASVLWFALQLPRGLPHTVMKAALVPEILVVAVFGTLLPFVFFAWGVRHAAADRAGIALTLEPVVGGLLAWAWLRQALAPLQLLGGAVTVAAIVALRKGDQPREE